MALRIHPPQHPRPQHSPHDHHLPITSLSLVSIIHKNRNQTRSRLRQIHPPPGRLPSPIMDRAHESGLPARRDEDDARPRLLREDGEAARARHGGEAAFMYESLFHRSHPLPSWTAPFFLHASHLSHTLIGPSRATSFLSTSRIIYVPVYVLKATNSNLGERKRRRRKQKAG